MQGRSWNITSYIITEKFYTNFSSKCIKALSARIVNINMYYSLAAPNVY